MLKPWGLGTLLITPEEIIALDPCYTEQKIYDLMPTDMTIVQILDLPIPIGDKVWVCEKLGYLTNVQEVETEEGYEGLERLLSTLKT